MTEQELITSMQGLTTQAASVLQNILSYASQNQDITFTVGGGNVVVPSLPKQVAQYAAQQAADRLAYTQNFGGLPTSQAVTRDIQGRISLITTTLANGYQHQMTPVRDPVSGRMSGATVQVKDPLGAVAYNVTKNFIFINGKYSGV